METLINVLLIVGAILTLIGFLSYLFIAVVTKRGGPEGLYRKFNKTKNPPANISGLVDMWAAITLGLAVIGLVMIVIAIFIAK